MNMMVDTVYKTPQHSIPHMISLTHHDLMTHIPTCDDVPWLNIIKWWATMYSCSLLLCQFLSHRSWYMEIVNLQWLGVGYMLTCILDSVEPTTYHNNVLWYDLNSHQLAPDILTKTLVLCTDILILINWPPIYHWFPESDITTLIESE